MKWLSLPGTAGNYARTPTTTGLDVTELDIMARVDTDLIVGNTDRTFIGRQQSASLFALVYRLGQEPNDLLKLAWKTAGSVNVQAVATAALPGGQQLIWTRATLDVDNGAGAYEVRFWTSTTDTQDPDSAVWSQLGATVVGGTTTSIIGGLASQLEVGSYNSGAVPYGSAIDVYRGVVRDGIGGTVIADFNATDFASGASAGATADDSTGKTWTIFGASSLIVGPPPGVTATPDSQSQITVAWSDIANETGYIVERSPDGLGLWVDVSGTLPADTIAYVDVGLSPATQYFYRVSAVFTVGTSAPGLVADATTTSPIPVPARLVSPSWQIRCALEAPWLFDGYHV